MICKHILWIRFLNEPEVFFSRVKWFKLYLRITNNSIKHQLFIYILLNDHAVLLKNTYHAYH